MGYEERREAMNDYIAERAREMMPDESEYTMDEDIPEIIEQGSFDVAVLKRTIKIVENLGVGSLGIVRSLTEILKEMKK